MTGQHRCALELRVSVSLPATPMLFGVRIRWSPIIRPNSEAMLNPLKNSLAMIRDSENSTWGLYLYHAASERYFALTYKRGERDATKSYAVSSAFEPMEDLCSPVDATIGWDFYILIEWDLRCVNPADPLRV